MLLQACSGKYRRRKTPTLTNVAVTLNTLTNPNLTLSKKLEAAHHRWMRGILGITWRDTIRYDRRD